MRLGLVLVLAISLTAIPPVCEGQPIGHPRVGYLGNGKSNAQAEAFRRGLRELGWIEGQTATIDYRWAEGNPDRLPALFGELVQAKVNVIVLAGATAIPVAKEAKSAIPIVFVSLADPVTLGFVPSLARPGGNMTGVASEFEELATKQLQLLREAIPNVSRVALLYRPGIAPARLDRGGGVGAEARSHGTNSQGRRGGRARERLQEGTKRARGGHPGATVPGLQRGTRPTGRARGPLPPARSLRVQELRTPAD